MKIYLSLSELSEFRMVFVMFLCCCFCFKKNQVKTTRRTQLFETGQTWKGHKASLLRKSTISQSFQISFKGQVQWFTPMLEISMVGRGIKQFGLMESFTHSRPGMKELKDL